MWWLRHLDVAKRGDLPAASLMGKRRAGLGCCMCGVDLALGFALFALDSKLLEDKVIGWRLSVGAEGDSCRSLKIKCV